jgi:uncharacterized protein
MLEMTLWGALLRFLQALVQAAPTILVGLLVVGLFRRLLGAEKTRSLFGHGTWRSLPQAWLIGMLLPVCSLGVIPVMREMRRTGLSGGTIVAFGLTAPLFNPISVLYGLTLSNPLVIFTFAGCSLLIVTVCGLVWDRCFATAAETPPRRGEVAYGIKRLTAVLVAGLRELRGGAWVYILIGLAGTAGLSMLLPAGVLQSAAEHDDPWAPLVMTGIAIAAYATPMTAMMQLASMFQHGNSVGAAFALLVLGAGTNLGLLAWLGREYGLRRSLAWFALLVAIVIVLAYALDRPLYPHGVEPVGHTHAFDDYCCPFHQVEDYPRAVAQTIRNNLAPHEMVGVGLLAVMSLAAWLLQWWDPTGKLERWLEREPRRRARYDRVLPAPVLGGVALAGLVALSVLGCYLYYPPPREIFEELRIVNVEVSSAALSKDWDTALHWIPICDDWTRKLEVSVVLRADQLTEHRRRLGHAYREKLDQLEHAVEDRDEEQLRELVPALNRAYRHLRAAYLESP